MTPGPGDGRSAQLPRTLTVVIVGEATETVKASPTDVFEFVLDLDRYRQADDKIGPVKSVERNGDRGTVTFGLEADTKEEMVRVKELVERR